MASGETGNEVSAGRIRFFEPGDQQLMHRVQTSIQTLRIVRHGEKALTRNMSSPSAPARALSLSSTPNPVVDGPQPQKRHSAMTERRTRSAANSPPGTPTLRHSTHSTAIHFPTLGLLKSLSSAAHTNVPMSNAELLEEAASRKKGHEDVERRKRYLVNGLLGHHSQPATSGTQESQDGSIRGRDRPRTQRRSASLSGLVRKRRTTDDHAVPSSPLAHETFTSAPRSLHTSSALASADVDQTASAPRRPAALDSRAATVTAAELSKLRASQPDLETGSSSHQTATGSAPRSAGPSVAAIASDLSAGARTPTTKPAPGLDSASATADSPQLSARHRQILDSSTELFCSRPTNEIFDRDWRDDAVFEDPLAYCKGRHEWAAQWFGMPKAFPQSRQLECRIVSATGGPGQPGQLQYEQTQEYTIAGVGAKKIMKSLVVIDLDADEKIVHFQDRWDGKPLGKRFGKYYAKRLNAKVMPWVISVPKKS